MKYKVLCVSLVSPEVEFEVPTTTWEAASTAWVTATWIPALLEELSEVVATEAASEWMAALLRHGVVGVVAVVEALAQLRVREHFIGFVDGGHLGF